MRQLYTRAFSGRVKHSRQSCKSETNSEHIWKARPFKPGEIQERNNAKVGEAKKEEKKAEREREREMKRNEQERKKPGESM